MVEIALTSVNGMKDGKKPLHLNIWFHALLCLLGLGSISLFILVFCSPSKKDKNTQKIKVKMRKILISS